MADPYATFVAYFQHEPDPYLPLGSVLTPFLPGANQPAELLANCASLAYPLPLLMAGTDHRPLLTVAPFAPDALPGMAVAARKYGFLGDVTEAGQLPGLVSLEATCFHQAPAVEVLTRGDVMAAWTTLPALSDNLGAPIAPAAPAVGAAAPAPPATHNVTTRRAMPVPHEYVATILERFNTGELTWRWLWENVAVLILADPAREAAYGGFLDYLQASSTRRPGPNPGDPERPPATEFDHGGGLVTPQVRDKGLAVARSFLPGLSPAVGVTAQLQQVQQQQQTIEQQIIAGQAPRPKMIERENPLLYTLLRKVCEVATEDELAGYWAMHASIKDAKVWNTNSHESSGPKCGGVPEPIIGIASPFPIRNAGCWLRPLRGRTIRPFARSQPIPGSPK
jgi:hypothetical protein